MPSSLQFMHDVLPDKQLLIKQIRLSFGERESMSPVATYPLSWASATNHLIRALFPDHPHFAPSGLSYTELLREAVSFSENGTIDILCLGPVTNVAKAFQEDRSLVNHIGRVIISGGSFKVPHSVDVLNLVPATSSSGVAGSTFQFPVLSLSLFPSFPFVFCFFTMHNNTFRSPIFLWTHLQLMSSYHLE